MKKTINQTGAVSPLLIVAAVSILALSVFVGYTQYKIKQNIRQSKPEYSHQTEPANTVPFTAEKNISGILSGQVLCTDKVNDRPCQSGFTLTRASSTNPGESVSNLAQIVQSDSAGKYSVNIAPGSYNIKPLPKKGYPVIVPINSPITVSTGKTTLVNISYLDGTK